VAIRKRLVRFTVAVGDGRSPHPFGKFDTFMTMKIAQAQEFVARWRRILIPWRAHTDAEAVRDRGRSCIGVIGGMALVIGGAKTLSFPWKLGVVVLAFVVAAIAACLSLRLRAVRRLFDSTGPQSFTDLT
jgi:hypothetical protein